RALDLFGGYRKYTIIGQCKGGTTVTFKDVAVFEGTLSRYDRSKTIAILIARHEYRQYLAQFDLDVFTKNASERANTSEYNLHPNG
ncbi:190_t:CDS:2, partial [Paraglomus occultum]